MHSVSLDQQRDETWIPWPRRTVHDMPAEIVVNIQKRQPYGLREKNSRDH